MTKHIFCNMYVLIKYQRTSNHTYCVYIYNHLYIIYDHMPSGNQTRLAGNSHKLNGGFMFLAGKIIEVNSLFFRRCFYQWISMDCMTHFNGFSVGWLDYIMGYLMDCNGFMLVKQFETTNSDGLYTHAWYHWGRPTFLLYYISISHEKHLPPPSKSPVTPTRA